MSGTETLPDWKSLQGTTLDGGYELKEIVEAAGERAILRVRVLGDYTLKASASFYVLNPASAEAQVAIWQNIRMFEKKTHVSIPLGTGTLLVDRATLAYLVFQNPEETLTDVLSKRALEPDETIDLLRTVSRGLEELHGNGFVHGCLSPDQVLAIRDSVVVSTECMRRVNAEPIIERKPAKYLAPESGTHNLTIASDVWCLGATVFEALTQKTYEPGLEEEAAALKHPFGTLTTRCLKPDPDQRCRLADLEAILRSKPPLPSRPKPVPVPPPMPPEPAKSAAPEVPLDAPAKAGAAAAEPTPIPTAPLPIAEKVQPVAAPPPVPTEAVDKPVTAKPVREGRGAAVPLPSAGAKLPNELRPERANIRNEAKSLPEEPAGSLSRGRGWAYAVFAFLTIFAALWLLRSRSRPGDHPSATPVQSTANNPKPTEAPGAAWPTKTLTPSEVKNPASTRHERAAAPAAAALTASRESGSTAGAKTVWRVVLYTYMHQQDAERKAEEIRGKRPGLQTEVFAPNEPAGPYLVVAGGRMNREGALHLRSRAIQEGMPHDSYIQNYSR